MWLPVWFLCGFPRGFPGGSMWFPMGFNDDDDDDDDDDDADDADDVDDADA